MPTESGSSGEDELNGQRWVKSFELELSNMDESPRYQLTNQLTIGSEIGNIVINDESIAARHATFVLQQEVVSVMDHGSATGTFINGAKIEAGKSIILEDTDVVLVGDLEVRIIVTTTRAAPEPVPDVPVEPAKTEAVEQPKSIPVEEKKVEEAPTRHDEKTMVSYKVKKNNSALYKKPAAKKSRFNLTIKSYYATNTIIRIFAIAGDLILSYAILVVLYPFDEFRQFLADVPAQTGALLDINWVDFFEAVAEDYPAMKELALEVFKLAGEAFKEVEPLFLIFIILRILSTFILGVSISEFFLGVRANGNVIWSRIGGVLRVIIGIVTGPFLIFDLPALVSRRTFKEFMTFTNTYVNSKFMAALGIILYLPLTVFLALVAPIFEGMEFPQPVVVNDVAPPRVKPAAAPEVHKVTNASRTFQLALSYAPEEIDVLPAFRFTGTKSKLSFTNGIVLYDKTIKRYATLQLVKKFDMRDLVGIALRGNYFLSDKYKTLSSFVHEARDGNKAFRKIPGKRPHDLFATEFISLTKASFNITPENLFDVMETETILVKNLIDFRASMESLLGYKDFDQIGLVQIGNLQFLKVTYTNQKPFDLLIPLMKGDGRLFRVDYDKREKLKDITNKLYNFILSEANWTPVTSSGAGEVLNAFEAVDFFASLDLKTRVIDPAKAQALYGFFFEKSASVLKSEDEAELGAWKKSVEGAVQIFTQLKPKEETPEDPTLKLIQNFSDLKEALDHKNKEFFGEPTTVTI